MRFYACHGTLLWALLRDYHMRFQLVCLSIPSVPTLCLKDPQTGNDTIYPELLLTVGMICWNKLPGF